MNYKNSDLISLFIYTDISWMKDVISTIAKNNGWTIKRAFNEFCYIYTR